MSSMYTLFAMDMGSTSTKVGFRAKDGKNLRENIPRPSVEYRGLEQELPLRKDLVFDFLERSDIVLADLDLFISRGGLGKPGPSGVYRINEAMRHDLMSGRYGEHVSALGPAIALDMSELSGREAVVIDPPSTDEFHSLARFSGHPDIPRTSAFHALNQKAVARRASGELGIDYADARLIVAHLGGGITVGAHLGGRVIDASHGLSEGPLTPERSGSLPTLGLLAHAWRNSWSLEQARSALVGKGGLKAYLGTSDAREVEVLIQKDAQARLVYEAMAYQTAKEICAYAAVLNGEVDAVVLTGGLACSELLVSWISDRVSFLGRIFVYPGEDEIATLLEGGLRVLKGEEPILNYPPE
jgi:butyrate kinase